jgi:hypothetical protein
LSARPLSIAASPEPVGVRPTAGSRRRGTSVTSPASENAGRPVEDLQDAGDEEAERAGQRPLLATLEIAGLVNAASAEIMNRIEPSWLIATIVQGGQCPVVPDAAWRVDRSQQRGIGPVLTKSPPVTPPDRATRSAPVPCPLVGGSRPADGMGGG